MDVIVIGEDAASLDEYSNNIPWSWVLGGYLLGQSILTSLRLVCIKIRLPIMIMRTELIVCDDLQMPGLLCNVGGVGGDGNGFEAALSDQPKVKTYVTWIVKWVPPINHE